MESNGANYRGEPMVPAPIGGGMRQPVPVSPNLPEYPYEPAYAEGAETDRRATLLRYLGILRKHRWLVLSVALVVFAVGAFKTFLETPIYRSAATIQIDREAAKIVNVENVQSIESNDAGFYPTQYELLKSRSLASRVVADLNLTEEPAFLRAGSPSAWSKLRRIALNAIGDEGDGGDESLSSPRDADVAPSAEIGPDADLWTRVKATAGPLLGQVAGEWQQIRRQAAAENAATETDDITAFGDFAARRELATGRILEGLSVQPVGTSRIVKVAFESPNPRVAAQIANAVSEGYIKTNLDRRYDASSYARKFLEERLQELKLKLEDSEKQLVQYAQDQQLVSLDGAGSMAQSKLSGASGALSEATNERLRSEQLWAQMKNTNSLALLQSTDSKAIDAIREKRAELAAEYEQNLTVFKPAYPAMQLLKTRLEEYDAQIQEEIKAVKASIEAKYLVAAKQESALQRYVETLKKEVLDFDRRNIQYKIIRREVDTNNSLYEGLLQRYKEIGVAGGVGTNNVAIVDRAQVPGSPFEPNLTKNLALSLALGIFLGALAAFAVEFFDDGVKLAEDIETTLGIPVLGITPLAASPKGMITTLDDPRSAIAEAFRSLRTALQFSTDAGAPKSLLITSPRPTEGKTTVSLALAKSFAQLGHRVLLIDCDLRDPSLHRILKPVGGPGVVTAGGLTNYLAGSATPPEVFQATEYLNLTFLPAGPLPPNPAELLAGPKMASLLRIAEEGYDIVILDGPPVMGLADAPLVSSIAAGTLLVLAANQSRRAISKAALKRLQFARAHMLGAVFNKFDHRKAGVSYGYGYGYGDVYYYGYGQDVTPQLSGKAA